LKEENQTLKIENQRLSEDKKYEESLSSIMNQLSLLPIINDNINKKLFSNNNSSAENNENKVY
jgi:hypothetical protein